MYPLNECGRAVSGSGCASRACIVKRNARSSRVRHCLEAKEERD